MEKEHIDPLVSVVVITYGHERFLLKCLESIVNQKTDFIYEVIISNDNSPDNSDSIIRNFIANNVRNNVIYRYFHHQNNKGMTENFIWALSQAQGKYIAYCEGDDVWLSEAKLQLQIDYLNKHHDISLCCGGFQDSSGEVINFVNNNSNNKQNLGMEFSLVDHFSSWIIKSLTLCFRNDSKLISFLENFKYARDIHLTYFLLRIGKGYYFNKIFGFYNIHDGGVVSTKTNEQLWIISYNVYKEFSEKQNDSIITRKYYNYATLLYKYSLNNVRFSEIFKGLINPKYTFSILKLLIKG